MNDDDLILDILGKRNTCVLRRERNHLRFGQYSFALEFIARDENQDKVKARLDKNLGCRYNGA